MEAKQIDRKTLIISLAAIVSVEWSLRVVVSKGLFDPMVTLGAARLLEIILVILVLLIWGRGVSSVGLAPSRIIPGLRKGLVWSAGFGIVAFFAFVVLYVAGVNAMILMQARLPTRLGEIILFFFIGGILAPIAEEIFFRGILYGFFRRWGVFLAVALSTLLFVGAHPVFHGIFVPQVVGGIVFAVAYEVGGSLLVPITIHVLGNMAIFTLSLIS
ncbi:MAG: type II CAAX endopeptidase family protein [Desulfobacteria bacterium]